MKKLIFLEYFTSQSSILKSRDKEIFKEALNLSDSIIRNFIKYNNVILPTFEGSAKIYDKAEKTLSKNWDTASVYEVLKMENVDE